MRMTSCTAACLIILAASSRSVAETDIRFNARIRPILSENCFACHGPDSASRKADLRLDRRETAIDSGVIEPGSAKDSELVARITSDDPDMMMPPPLAHKKLKPSEKQLLMQWIDAGAEWEEHWSFIKPQRSALPAPAGAESWARSAIDAFVLEKLNALGLKPNGAEDRYTLARRASFDITGLPPEKEMLEEFIADNDEGAFSRFVDALLASEHAGEHRARYWLDAARYGDTHGMHVDNYREIWPYRDWVINAFNANMPFDQFVVEQIAGDLLPHATLDQRIATGFNRCNITTSEGGAIPAELDVRYMVDRVETTATVFMGLTAGCAVCHDHKYDPLSQREFYQLGAFFNNTTQPAMDGNRKDTPPVVTLPASAFADEWNTLEQRRHDLLDKLAAVDTSPETWWQSHPRKLVDPTASDALLVSMPLTAGEGDPIKMPAGAKWAADHPAGRRGIWFADAGNFSVDFPTLRSDQPLTVSFWIKTPEKLSGTTLFEQIGKTKDNKTVGWKINTADRGDVTFELFDHTGQKIRGLLPDNEALRPRTWQHVCVRYSGGQSNSSISILVNGTAAFLRNSSESLVAATELATAPLKIATRVPTAALSDIRIYRRWLSDVEVRLLAQDYRLKRLLQSDAAWDDLEAADRDLITQYTRAAVDKDARELSRQLAETQTRRDFIYSRSTTTLVMQERATPPRAWVLYRGQYDQRREEVAPNVPAVLPPLPKDLPANRLALARWLVSPENPLTARVTMNRLWQSVFGTGLVKTAEDFGVMGDPPTHLKLLDWLAVEFVESGWDVNHMLKLILTSAAYRQSNIVTPAKLKADPANRYLSRGPRLRLDAESLRDQALAVSGLLREDVGGPSVKPYQPAGLWRVVAITGSNTRNFKKDTGDALYRRSVYTFWKRTAPPPSMAAFNAPTREQCTVRRERTNTPIQALVLMNDPQFVESARRLAETAIKQQATAESRARWMLTTVLAHPADEADVAELASAAGKLQKLFQQKPKMAKGFIATGDSKPDEQLNASEVAAWAMIANTLMNRDDFINK